MQLLTDLGYKNIDDCVIGEKLIAYDINDGHLIINELEAKQWFSPDMFVDEWSVPEQVVIDGIPQYEQIPMVDENGDYLFDDEGNQLFENGEPIMTESVLVKTKEQIFEDTYGELKFLKINDTWTLFKNQSVWANLRVVHATDLQIGDVIYDDDDNDVTITSIEEVEVDGWWRLTVSGDHSYIADNLTLHNASRYWVGGGASANWNATGNTNWGSASGLQDNASVPTSTDDVTFDGAGTGGNTNSTISATITILSLNITSGYTATMTHNAVLTIAGNWTFGTSYTIAGTSGVTISAASTITSGGKTWPNNLTFSGTNTKTLSGNLTVSGLLTTSGSTTLNSTTSEIITLSGGMTISFNLSGTAPIYITGGTWSGSGGGTVLTSNVFIQGNITVSGSVYYGTNTLTYVSGTVTTTGSTLFVYNNATLNTNGIAWNNITIGNIATITLTSNLLANGTFTIPSTYNAIINKTTSETFTIAGGFTINALLTGTIDIYLTGGTWSGGSAISNNIFIQGNVTVSGTVTYRVGTLSYVSGTVTTTGSTLSIIASCTLNTNGITWNNITSTGTITLTSNLSMSGLFTVSGATTLTRTTAETWTTSGGITVNAALSGTAKVILTGGTWSSNGNSISTSLDIQGNVTISGSVIYAGTATSNFTYVSGTITTTGSTITFAGIPNYTISSGSIIWNNVTFVDSGTKTINGNFTVNGLCTINSGGTITLNKTSSEILTLNGGLTMTSGNLAGTIDVYLKGGTWSATLASGATVRTNLFIDGNVTISSDVWYSTNILTYVSGTIKTTGSRLIINANTTVLNFHKVPLPRVLISAAQTVTMNRFFTGTPSQICQVSSTGANYTIDFQDGFEKIARNVAISGCTISRPNQLLVINNSRFNTNRSTNIGIRYINQSPNGVARNMPSINDTMTAPAMGLVNDPNFIKQG